MLDWTGERYLPGVEGTKIHYEHLHRYRFAREFVKGKKVLDLACGEGYGSFMLAEDAGQIVGIDIDEIAVKHASSKYLKDNLKFIRGSITEVPLKEEKTFDVIVCFEALEHIGEHQKLLQEVKRLIKDDGIFIVSTPNKYIYSDKANYKNEFHVKELYRDEFTDLLNKNFKNTLLYGQMIYTSSNIFPLFENSGIRNEYVIERNEKTFLFVPPEKKEARFFIAVSSDAPPKDIAGNSYLVDVAGTSLAALEAEATLNQIFNSRGWKVLSFFYKILNKVLSLKK